MTERRLLVMAMPSVAVADSFETRLEQHGVCGELGDGEFARSNWHQSLSDRYWPHKIQDLEAKLQRALRVLVARPAKLTFNCIASDNGRCRIEADGNKAFRALLLAIKRALATQGLVSSASNRPHVSLSYWGATAGLNIEIEPIEWVIDRVLAVEGWKEGRNYRYREIAGISLNELPPTAQQPDLF